MQDPLDGPGTEALAILACVAIGAAVAALQSSLHALGDVRLRAIRDAGGRHANLASRALERGRILDARLLTARVLALATASGLAAQVGLRYDGIGAVLGAAAGVAVVFAVAVEVASTLAAARATRWALFLLRALRPVELLVAPLAAPLAGLGRLVDKLFPAQHDEEENDERITALAVEHMIDEGEERGALTELHADLLRSVLEFKDTVAREVMVPRTQVTAFEIDTPFEEVVETITEVGHSRYPVYRERVDHIEGVLYAKDLFGFVRAGANIRLADVIKGPVFFAPEKQKIGVLLNEMQRRRVHLAVVVDEFGGTSGIVTLEDILEEIVGEIRDEHDDDEEPVVERIDAHRFLADGTASVYDVQDAIEIEFVDDGKDWGSVGGLVVELAGRVPPVGESLELGPVDLVVREADERHVEKVEIVVRPPTEPDSVEAA